MNGPYPIYEPDDENTQNFPMPATRPADGQAITGVQPAAGQPAGGEPAAKHPAAAQQVVDYLLRPVGGGQAAAGDLDDQAADKVVEQVLADLRPVGDHVDAVRVQFRAVADARQHQQLR